MKQLLEAISTASTTIIVALAAVHLLCFLMLWAWYRRDLWRLAGTLDEFTRQLKHRSVLDRGSNLQDQISAFLQDIRDVTDSPQNLEGRAALRSRLQVLDERRVYLQSLRFETCYNLCRNMIEAYPLAGILGTILAIAAALQTDTATSSTVGLIVQRFGEAIWSTCAGLVAAVFFLFINGLLETSFIRLETERDEVRKVVHAAKRSLMIDREAET